MDQMEKSVEQTRPSFPQLEWKGRVREAVICPKLIDVPLMPDDALQFSKSFPSSFGQPIDNFMRVSFALNEVTY